jgi:phosphatidylglycerophosphatase A
MIEWFALFCSSAGFAGFIPGLISRGRFKGGGGMMGSLGGVALQVYCMQQPDAAVCQIGFIMITLGIGIYAIPVAELFMLRRWGSRRRHTGEWVGHDFNETCIDEVHGQLIAGLPVYWLAESPFHGALLLAISFCLFRFFDAKKLGPVKWVEEQVPGSFGIMLDDTLAGLLAAATLTCLILFA